MTLTGGDEMTGRNTLFLAAGSTGLVGTAVASVVMWAVLTNPVAIVNEAMAHDAGGRLQMAVVVVHDMIFHLAKYL